MAGTLNQYVSIPEKETSRSPELSLDRHFQRWDRKELDDFVDKAVYDEDEIRRLEEVLSEHRLLVITGEEEIGKGAIARLLAARLSTSIKVFYSRGLRNDVAVSLERLSDKNGCYAGCLLIFRDAFVSQNQGLLRITRELDPGEFGRLKQRLTASGTFLVLTSDRSWLRGADAEARLRGLGILQEVKGPNTELLLQDLHRRAQVVGLEEGLRDPMGRVVGEHGQRIVAELRTVPRIDRFVSFYLVAVAKEDLKLDEALARAQKRDAWLFSELVSDIEAWSFVLALVLAQPLPSPEGVPWYLFYGLWRKIVSYLRRELRLPRESRPAKSLMVDREILDRVHAQVRRVPPGTDIIQFQSSVDPSALWEVLLSPGRSLVSSLVPLLKRLVDEGDSSVCEAAARALGRMGRVDPMNMVFPLIQQWSKPDAPGWHRTALGRMLQGVFGGRDAEYRELCLRQFRYAALWQSGKNVWPGAIALREIGRLDLSLAIRELVDLLGRGLRDRPGQVSADDRDSLRKYEMARRSLSGRGDSTEEDRIREALDLAVPVMFSTEDEWHAFYAVQIALSGLCLAGSPIRVLSELRLRLLERAEGKLLPLITLLFLDPGIQNTGGIADRLERNKTSLPVTQVEDGKAAVTLSINDLLFFASFEDGATERLCEFLVTVFRGIEEFPGLIARSFKAKFALLLKSLARDAVQVPDVQNTCAVLFALLLDSEDRDLKEMVFQMLKRDPDFTKEGSRMAELARQALVPRKLPRMLSSP